MRKQLGLITDNQGHDKKIEVEIVHLSTKARVIKALKLFIISLVLAVVSILIPVFHFVLVPIFISLAFILPIHSLGNNKAMTTQKFSCPHCSATIVFKNKAFKLEVKNFCLSCHRQLKIKLLS